jgi:hypothetical protein
MIQYPRAFETHIPGGDYWIPAFAGYDAVGKATPCVLQQPGSPLLA